jgi:hypothetical protein
MFHRKDDSGYITMEHMNFVLYVISSKYIIIYVLYSRNVLRSILAYSLWWIIPFYDIVLSIHFSSIF